MVAFGFYIDKKLLNEGCGLRDAKWEVDMQILLESDLDSWNRFETKMSRWRETLTRIWTRNSRREKERTERRNGSIFLTAIKPTI